MAYSAISKSSLYFNTKLYTGTGSSNALTGVGFQPDWTWIKRRNSAGDHELYDAVRGVTKALYSNGNSAEYAHTNGLTAFGTDGFTVGSGGSVNNSSDTFASWNWKANGSSTTTNNDGATTSYISHNSTAQFSIIKYTGTGSATNIGHGLNGTPDCFITKGYSGATDWHLWNNSFTANQRIKLNSNGAVTTNTSIFHTLPDATKIYFGSGGDVNGNGVNYICYAWKNVKGFSKSGPYTGNDNADGAFVYCGFKPRWLMITRSDAAGYHWRIYDTARSAADGGNPLDKRVNANLTEAEGTHASDFDVDVYSTGFKLRTSSQINVAAAKYVFIAFAESPFVSSEGTPTTAR